MEQALPLQGFSRKIFNRVHEANFSAAQIVPVALFAFILLTSLLLMLPFATMGAEGIHFIDAFFTMTSAICVTGLIVLDTPKDFTLFGQLVILSGIQVGGLGYSTMAITLIIETVGALILAARFAFDMGPLRAIYLGVFHSVSAFNNAGFSLFSANLAAYRGDIVVNLTIAALIILGGIGFIIFRDLLDNVHGARFRLSTHTKLALLVTLLLIVGGTVGIWAFEAQNQSSVGNLPFGEQILVAYFHSVSARTAGFNTVDLSLMATPTLYLLVLLMIVGGEPGSTAGGIKATTFGIVCASIWATLRVRAAVMVFHRRIPQEIVMKSFILAAVAWGLVTGFTMVLSYSENLDFLKTLFEVASAAGTVGLSTGNGDVLSLSALFSDFGKALIILTMFLGRLGPLALGLFAVRTHEELRYRYAEAKVVIG